ncbi:GNAT family N-acetyltransferase [Proteus vulgaris]|uniref:GNAT family N-acetyltransferase n=1 Tax=Proteus vulgaris TaxID=585 RepID=UPI0032DA30C6
MIKVSVVNSKTEMDELQSAVLAEPVENKITPFAVGDHLLRDDCNYVTLAIRDKDVLVGHAICHAMGGDDGYILEISKLYIHESQRRKGYANQAVDEIVLLAIYDGINEVFSEAIDENAANFWSKTDFEFITNTKRYKKNLNDN